MRNIGILTFHNADNHGAVLQAYALQKMLSVITEENVEIIDYRCTALEAERYPRLKHTSIKSFVKSLALSTYYAIKRTGFARFRKKYLNISKTVYYESTINKSNDIYDIFVCGSDQIWNLGCSKGDYAYFLNFVNERNRKIAYAASLGTYKYSEDEKNKVEVCLESFDGISVREASALEEINIEGSEAISVLPDPVFLLQTVDWEKLMYRRIINEKYILVYLIQPDVNVMKNAEKYAEKHNCRIISNKTSVEFILNNSPDKFLSFIYYADAVFTNSFHGTAFSVLFNKPLGADIQLMDGRINNRIADLLKSLSSMQCIINSEMVSDVYLPDADADKLKKMVQDAVTYLSSHVQEAI